MFTLAGGLGPQCTFEGTGLVSFSFKHVAVLCAAGALLAGCATTTTETSSGAAAGSDAAVTIGTTDKVTSLDPAGAYDNGSFNVMNQIYPFLFNTQVGATDMTPQPDIAESGEFTQPNEFTVTLKSGLTFANGNPLTSSDVKFTFDRLIGINDPNGPASLLGSLESVDAPDDTTVVFHLSSQNDQTFTQVLSSPAGPIVDEDVFPADSILPDADIAAGKPFAGQYSITSYSANELIAFEKFDGYQGMLGAAKNDAMNFKYYADSNNLKLDIEQGNIDVAYRSLSATDIESLSGNDAVQVIEGPGGEIRYLVFNMNTMPYGATTPENDPAKAKAVRQAMASVIDREAIATDVYKGTYSPLYGHIPAGLNSAKENFKELYGDGAGAPDVDKARATLEAAGVETPVAISLQYNPDHYGPSSGDEYAAIKSQLEESGLFTVDLQSTEWVQYNKDRVEDVYPVYQLGWFPDYSDPDNYLTPFFAKNNFVGNHYEPDNVDALIRQQVSEADPAARTGLLEEIQAITADEIPTLPLLQGKQIAVAKDGVNGVALDASFKFRAGAISK